MEMRTPGICSLVALIGGVTRAMMSKQPKWRFQASMISALVLALLPVVYVLHLALNSGEVPSNDYWAMLAKFFSADGFSSNPVDWFQLHNNHILTFSYVIYALNILVAKGSNIGLSLVSWSLALIQMLLLFALVPRLVWCDRLWRILLLISISAFTFTPAAALNWIYGFSGVHYCSSFMFSVASIYLLTHHIRSPHPRSLIGCLGLALLATLSYSSAMPLWPLLFLCLVLHRRFRLQAISVLVLAAVVFFAYAVNYQPHIEQEPTDVHLSEFILFIPTCLGGIFTIYIEVAMLIGLGGLFMSLYLIRRTLIHSPSRRRLLPWILLHGLALADMLMAAMVRSGRGLEEAVSSRYAHMPALYWLSLIVIASFVFRCSSGKNRWRLAVTASSATGLMVVMMYVVGIGYAEPLLHRAALQPIAEISVQLGVPDIQAVKGFITPWPHTFMKLLPDLERHEISPFRTLHNSNGRVGTTFRHEMPAPAAGAESPGRLTTIHRYSRSAVQCSGWIAGAGGDVRGIVILNRDNVIRGFGASGSGRPWTAHQLSPGPEKSGWVGYAVPVPDDQYLTACALFSGDDLWVPLGRFRRLPMDDGSNTPSPIFDDFRIFKWKNRWFSAGRFLSRTMWQRYGKLSWR